MLLQRDAAGFEIKRVATIEAVEQLSRYLERIDGDCRGVLAAQSVKPQARILGYATAAREPEWFTVAPIGAISKLLDQLSLKVSEVDLFEVNEAFSVVSMAATSFLSSRLQ